MGHLEGTYRVGSWAILSQPLQGGWCFFSARFRWAAFQDVRNCPFPSPSMGFVWPRSLPTSNDASRPAVFDIGLPCRPCRQHLPSAIEEPLTRMPPNCATKASCEVQGAVQES